MSVTVGPQPATRPRKPLPTREAVFALMAHNPHVPWTREEAAVALGIAPKTLTQLTNRPNDPAPCVRISFRAVRYDATELLEWARRVGAKEDPRTRRARERQSEAARNRVGRKRRAAN